MESPDLRATIIDGRLTLCPWTPGLQHPGPRAPGLDDVIARGGAVADLTCIPESDELVVAFAGPCDSRAARRALLRWAHLVGYRRVWLPGEVVALDPVTAPLEAVGVDCAHCGTGYADGDPEFWEFVRANHCFPDCCLVCGATLAQWLPAGAKGGRRGAAGGARTGRGRSREAPARR